MQTGGLTAEETRSFARDGHLSPCFRLSDTILEALRQAAAALIAARSDLRPEFVPMPHVPLSGRAEHLAVAEPFLRFAREPAVLDMIESVIGPDIVLWAGALFSKPGGDGRALPWHQDGIYWPLRPMATVTLWVALDRADRENGCMRVIPGSHRQGFLAHETSDEEGLVLNTGLVEGSFAIEKARAVELEAGQVSLHDAFLVHGSEPNTSPRRRTGLTLRYMPATSLYDRAKPVETGSNTAPLNFAERPIWLLRGQDHAGNDFRRGHLGQQEARAE